MHVFMLCSQAATPEDRAQQRPPEQCWKLAFQPVCRNFSLHRLCPAPKPLKAKATFPGNANMYVGFWGLFLFVCFNFTMSQKQHSFPSKSHLSLFSCLWEGKKRACALIRQRTSYVKTVACFSAMGAVKVRDRRCHGLCQSLMQNQGINVA